MLRLLHVVTSAMTSATRLRLGSAVGPLGERPAKPLELYEFEGCPFCRKVREALSILDLDARILPCPKRGPHYREELVRRAGKAQFPYLVDPNTGSEMYESDAIVAYLFGTYGAGPPPLLLRCGLHNDLSSVVANLWRFSQGAFYRPARAPQHPLELYSYEESPTCRLVRERLCSLELPYTLRNLARGSARRSAFIERSGAMRVPYLVDPNTAAEMFESPDILRYLDSTYAIRSGWRSRTRDLESPSTAE